MRTPAKLNIPVRLTVLGCGSSSGSPVIGCNCPTCCSDNPKNKRLRSSAWVQVGDISIVIDTGPDFRTQALRENIEHIDAVLYTHPHADHLHGIDDLRVYCFRQKGGIPVYSNQFTLDNITSRFGHAFLPVNKHWDKPVLQAKTVSRAFYIKGVKVTPIFVQHGSWTCCDFRIGNIAWLTDMKSISDKEIKKLRNLDYLFLDCLREEPYPSHLGWDEAMALAKKINAKQTYLIHMAHLMEYETSQKKCPPGVAIAYDGLVVCSDDGR